VKNENYEPMSGMKRRCIFGILLPLLLLVGGVIAGLCNICIVQHQYYAEMANNTHFSTITISANRGSIYDAKGIPLAWSATVYKVYIDPSLFQDELDEIEEIMEERQKKVDEGGKLEDGKRIISREDLVTEIVDKLSEELEISTDSVESAIEKNTQYCVLQTQVSKDVADELMKYFDELGMSSVQTEEDTKRYYPQNDLAAQVIGFTNGDGDGQYGLEYYYNEYLSGTNGRVISATDAMGNEMPYRYSTTYDAQDGSSLYLTLDATLQYYLDKNLQEMSEKFNVANRSCGIIMNAKTGAIYAMSTYPSFDLNNPSEIYDEATNEMLLQLPEEEYQEAYIEARETQWKNKAISELYVPGSVFKIFTSAAAIEEDVVDPESFYYNCTGSYTIEGAEPIHCHKTAGHGYQSFSEALTNSCNPAFIEIGLRLGIDKFSEYFAAFGLTEKTGIDLPGEVSSLYRSASNMSRVDLASSSFGQSNKLTPIEMITGIAAAVNGGYLVEPHVVSKIVSSDGNVLETMDTTVRRQVVSEETSAEMRELLQAVVDDNGGSNAYIKGYAVGGKSGTSQKLDEYSTDEDMQYVASYVCFAPADDPEIIILIMADEPDTEINYYGSYVCAPYAAAVMEEALQYLGYYPEYTEEEYAELDVTVPLLIDTDVQTAQSTLDELGLQYDIVGEGTNVVGQCPMTGATVSAGGKVIIYTESDYTAKYVTVPDLSGYTPRDANLALTNLGLNYLATGASSDRTDVTVQTQSVEAGAEVPVGTVIQLTYAVNKQGD
jgi:stage V sporulation protein D (sporulation-specific penicillin-binding protein)